MADETVDTKTWYEQHKDAEREYVRVYAAIPVQPGDRWTEHGFIDTIRAVREPGYKIKAYTGLQDHTETLLGTDDFAAKAEDAGKLYSSTPKEDFSAEDFDAMTPIKKGTEFISNGVFAADAECDGYLYKTPKGNVFLSNYSVSAAFNYAGQKFETDGAMVVRLKDEPAIRGIILDDDVTFDFKSGPYKAEKGSFIMPNPADEDGFTAYPPGFATYGLRLNQSDAAMDAIADVKTDESIKVGHALHFKPKMP